MKSKYFFLLLLTLLIVNSSLLIGTVRYVSKTGTSTPPYTSWQTSSDCIQKCINICVDGDTIYVANGVYRESLLINVKLNLIGSSMDSTIVDGSGLAFVVVKFTKGGYMSNFLVKAVDQDDNKYGMLSRDSSLILTNCRIRNVYRGFGALNSTSYASNCIIDNISTAFDDECPNNDCQSVYKDNVIISNGGTFNIINFFYGGYPTFLNNLVVDLGYTTFDGLYSNTSGTTVKNNIFAGYIDEGLHMYSFTGTYDSVFNNVVTNMRRVAIYTGTGSNTLIRNNIIQKSPIGIDKFNPPLTRSDYNLFWQVQQLMNGQPFIGDSNIVANPMFINDTIPRLNGTYDYHLQAFSPNIDKGDPDILDKDGTRSDIGLYGGPFGEIYTYQDLAPLAPRNLSAVVDTNQILLKWNRNTEADTAYYKVYRDTLVNFQIDSTKLVSSSSDSSFVQVNPHINTRYVYKVTCVDNQGNESLPSNELVVNITSVSTIDYPMTISDYLLYQNYPNPFNPSTKIGYQLKQRAHVNLMVYDIKGELISVLVNKEQNAGYYEVDFNVGNGLPSVPKIQGLASGIYLYRIEVIGEGRIPVYTEMKKMLLVK